MCVGQRASDIEIENIALAFCFRAFILHVTRMDSTANPSMFPVSRIGRTLALKGKSFSPIITFSGFGRLFINALRFWRIYRTASENRNNLVCISGVRGYEEDGVAYLHIEDSARGLGFTQTKGETEYTNVRWSRVDECLQDLNFLPQVAENGNPHDYYIPENIFYTP